MPPKKPKKRNESNSQIENNGSQDEPDTTRNVTRIEITIQKPPGSSQNLNAPGSGQYRGFKGGKIKAYRGSYCACPPSAKPSQYGYQRDSRSSSAGYSRPGNAMRGGQQQQLMQQQQRPEICECPPQDRQGGAFPQGPGGAFPQGPGGPTYGGQGMQRPQGIQEDPNIQAEQPSTDPESRRPDICECDPKLNEPGGGPQGRGLKPVVRGVERPDYCTCKRNGLNISDQQQQQPNQQIQQGRGREPVSVCGCGCADPIECARQSELYKQYGPNNGPPPNYQGPPGFNNQYPPPPQQFYRPDSGPGPPQFGNFPTGGPIGPGPGQKFDPQGRPCVCPDPANCEIIVPLGPGQPQVISRPGQQQYNSYGPPPPPPNLYLPPPPMYYNQPGPPMGQQGQMGPQQILLPPPQFPMGPPQMGPYQGPMGPPPMYRPPPPQLQGRMQGRSPEDKRPQPCECPDPDNDCEITPVDRKDSKTQKPANPTGKKADDQQSPDGKSKPPSPQGGVPKGYPREPRPCDCPNPEVDCIITRIDTRQNTQNTVNDARQSTNRYTAGGRPCDCPDPGINCIITTIDPKQNFQNPNEVMPNPYRNDPNNDENKRNDGKKGANCEC